MQNKKKKHKKEKKKTKKWQKKQQRWSAIMKFLPSWFWELEIDAKVLKYYTNVFPELYYIPRVLTDDTWAWFVAFFVFFFFFFLGVVEITKPLLLGFRAIFGCRTSATEGITTRWIKQLTYVIMPIHPFHRFAKNSGMRATCRHGRLELEWSVLRAKEISLPSTWGGRAEYGAIRIIGHQQQKWYHTLNRAINVRVYLNVSVIFKAGSKCREIIQAGVPGKECTRRRPLSTRPTSTWPVDLRRWRTAGITVGMISYGPRTLWELDKLVYLQSIWIIGHQQKKGLNQAINILSIGESHSMLYLGLGPI